MTKEKLLGIIRHILTFGGGFLLAKGLIDEVYLDELISAISTIIGFIWSVASKKTSRPAIMESTQAARFD